MTGRVFTVTLNPGLDRTLTVPAIYFDQVLRASQSRLDWGGKGFNVSRTLQVLGVASVAMGFVGGFTGQMLEQGLQRLGIATDFIAIDEETRTNTVVLEAESRRYVKVNEAGPRIPAPALAALMCRVEQMARPGDLWVLCGSLPPGVPVDCYAHLIQRVQAAGARALLDASGPALAAGLAARPFLIKPNAEEAAELLQRPLTSRDDQVQAVAALLATGVDIVALSLGADGLLLADVSRAVAARPPQVAALNPVGAGDALLAGLVWGLLHGADLAELARMAVAAGTAAAMQDGVAPGTQREVEALRGQVSVEQTTSPR
jgi:1-phosphofructokinase family hexose kinase